MTRPRVAQHLRFAARTALLFGLAACGHTPEPAAAPSAQAATSAQSTVIRDGRITAPDGVTLHYREGGRGSIALFFLHGWLGDAHWWDEQLTHFAPRYRVVAMDLAGHGESGKDRKAWSYQAAGSDARAVAEALGLERIVWIGHSMSGEIIIEAANQIPSRTVCLIPIDTLKRIGGPATREETEAFFASLEKDFLPAAQAIVKRNFVPTSPEPAVQRVLRSAATAEPRAVVPLLRSGFTYDGRSEIRKIKVPIVAVNSDYEPTHVDENRRYAPRFELIPIKSTGHWPMLERPSEFDPLLQQAIDRGTRQR
ncbi:alpha/beta fold hydrolase [Pendulispora albinea]|uniref:Alpha/beta hydrolase n=1 Tax=Pendulispora albinea TaxID=2741071 RepID=A0ABZ2MBZ5_9BACT